MIQAQNTLAKPNKKAFVVLDENTKEKKINKSINANQIGTNIDKSNTDRV
ncbi:MAG: hypothetical protein WCP57_04915 [Bacteroidota bacterium]